MTYGVIYHCLDSLSPILKLAIIMEKLRLIFKMVSFASVIMQQDEDADEHNAIKTDAYQNGFSTRDAAKRNSEKFTIGKFIYFLFAPTLLYRASYPRNTSIDWYKVWLNFYHFVIVLFCGLLITTRMMIPTMENVGKKRQIELIELFNMLYNIMLISIPIFFIFFYGFWECYLNLAAELLKFADRTFYHDWWNAQGPVEMSRKWNTLIHDFIHEICYKPLSIRYGRTRAMGIVFAVSGILHEYPLRLSFGVPLTYFWILTFAIPAIVGAANFVLHKISNQNVKTTPNDERTRTVNTGSHYILFMMMVIMLEVVIFLYCVEFYARKNCPTNDNMIWDQKGGLESFALNCLQITEANE